MPAAKLFATTLLAASLMGGAALAQSAAPAPSTTPKPQTEPLPVPPSPGLTHPQAVHDEDLRKFAAATAKIRLIDRDYTKKKDGLYEADRARLSKEEDEAKLAAVKEVGLTPDRYNAISKQIQDDPVLAQKAYEYIYAAPVRKE